MAKHVRFLASAQSFWFTLDTSYDHGCHLARRLRLNPEEYEALLIVAGLAWNTKHGFKMKPDPWRRFLGGHHFAEFDITIEFEQKSIDLDAYINGMPPSRDNRRKFYALRIGNKTSQSANKIEEQIGRDARLLTVPPRLNGLKIKN
jgi:hypothetical protein